MIAFGMIVVALTLLAWAFGAFDGPCLEQHCEEWQEE